MFVYTISDIVGAGILLLVLIVTAVIVLVDKITQALCKHNGGVNETMSCQAICRKCGKNLGFIGTWRKKQKQGS